MQPATFRKKVLDFYTKNARDFPWRRTTDPYEILVSEIMLQQTQTFRVVPKYQAFLKAFPTAAKLSKAPLSRVLALWQGLGYNRRALLLQRAAMTVTNDFKGEFPQTYDQLRKLPGVGPYTAGALLAFAFNKPALMVETNIRAALIHEFFPVTDGSESSLCSKDRKIADSELLSLLESASPKSNYRQWYQALMDYGAFLKQKYPNPSRRSKHHAVQSKFEGSDRQVRGEIIRQLTQRKRLPVQSLLKNTDERFARAVKTLERDGLIKIKAGVAQIA
jgi:A/G-specific adenine glycosylase